MKNYFLLLLVCAFTWASCSKDEPTLSDEEKIQMYLTENNIVAESTASGLHYVIHEEGIGTNPDLSKVVQVNYTGYLLDGTEFDATDGTPRSFQLGEVIQGWQEGLQLMKRQGSATFFIPSYLGYGPISFGVIPSNAVLIFDVELVDFL